MLAVLRVEFLFSQIDLKYKIVFVLIKTTFIPNDEVKILRYLTLIVLIYCFSYALMVNGI